MAKKILVLILATVLLLAVLFVPIPKSSARDGGTREYSALTYKIVDWNRLTTDGVYDATKIYWFSPTISSPLTIYGLVKSRKWCTGLWQL